LDNNEGTIRIESLLHFLFRPDPAPDPEPANQNFKIGSGSQIRITDPTGT